MRMPISWSSAFRSSILVGNTPLDCISKFLSGEGFNRNHLNPNGDGVSIPEIRYREVTKVISGARIKRVGYLRSAFSLPRNRRRLSERHAHLAGINDFWSLG